MKDAQLRNLERGGQDAERWLLERLRAGEPYQFGPIETACPAMFEACEAVRAAGQSAVLLLAERESGAQRLARASNRILFGARAPFVHESCQVTESLLHVELVGGVRGGLHGRQPPCLIYQASGGTLYLDEADHLSPAIQELLIQLLQEGTYRELESGFATEVNITFEARPLRLMLSAESDESLLPALKEVLVPIRVPPLRERGVDLELLVPQITTRVFDTSPEVWELLRSHTWPTNYRAFCGVMKELGETPATPEQVVELLARNDWTPPPPELY